MVSSPGSESGRPGLSNATTIARVSATAPMQSQREESGQRNALPARSPNFYFTFPFNHGVAQV